VSADKRYVMKFFKTRFYPFAAALLSFPLIPKEKRKQRTERALFKLRRDFTSYIIAGSDLKEETGTLYVHLNVTDDLKKKVRIEDKLGIVHELELDRFMFAVQRRAELATHYLDSLIQSGEFEQAKMAMHSLIDLSVSRWRKGIYDEDAKLEGNFGFIEGRPVFIDIGRFVRDTTRQNENGYKNDRNAMAQQLRTWLELHHPELTDYFCEGF
jgi:hypothetical protein